MTSLIEDDHGLALSVSRRQVNGEGLIEVTTHRHGQHSIEELRSRAIREAQSLSSARRPQGGPADSLAARSASTAEVAWTPAVIRVDDVPTDFAIASLEDGWVAIGEGPSSTITVAARKVPLAEVSLVRLPTRRQDADGPAGSARRDHGLSRPRRSLHPKTRWGRPTWTSPTPTIDSQAPTMASPST